MLVEAQRDALASVVDAKVADAIVNVREGKVKVIPGYDGVYGQLDLGALQVQIKPKPARGTVQQLNMADFF